MGFAWKSTVVAALGTTSTVHLVVIWTNILWLSELATVGPSIIRILIFMRKQDPWKDLRSAQVQADKPG